MNGEWKEGNAIEDAFVQVHKQLLGTAREIRRSVSEDIIVMGPILTKR